MTGGIKNVNSNWEITCLFVYNLIDSTHAVAKRVNMKLAVKYYWAYKIMGKVGKVSYKLKLPTRSKIQHGFHVSLLKKQVGPTLTTSTSLPEVLPSDQVLSPKAILDSRDSISSRKF
jgi:hypothetical protein